MGPAQSRVRHDSHTVHKDVSDEGEQQAGGDIDDGVLLEEDGGKADEH